MRSIVAVAGMGLAVLACGCGSEETEPTTASAVSKPAHNEVVVPLPPSAAPIPTSFVHPEFRPPKVVQVQATPEEIRAVQDDVVKWNQAYFSGDFPTLLRLQHPTWIDQNGGPERALDILRSQVAQSTARGMRLESLEFVETPFFQKTSVREYVFVRTRKILAVGPQRAEVTGYQLGARAIGDPVWTYVDGAKINERNVQSLFPDFPVGSPLPLVANRKL